MGREGYASFFARIPSQVVFGRYLLPDPVRYYYLGASFGRGAGGDDGGIQVVCVADELCRYLSWGSG